MRLAIYHHVYAGGAWRPVLADNINALWGSGLLDGDSQLLHIGIVGPPVERERVVIFLQRHAPCEVVIEATRGYEQVTLDALYDDACKDEWDAALYLHTKGATYSGTEAAWGHAWRRSMLRGVALGWEHCVKLLADVDAVGCHWLTAEEFPGVVERPFFGGNFWWANADYVRTLEHCSRNARHDAEAWIGSGQPAVADLKPGWPGWDNLLP